MVEFWVGVSGFSYPSWKGNFYPSETRAENMLKFYSSMLNSAEINSTYYNMPNEKTTWKWSESTGENFRFCFKANRRITHIKKLRNTTADVSFFVKALEPLGKKLGCVLVQLPPYVRFDLRLLEAFLTETSPSTRFALEFRHDSWFKPETYKLLENHDVALCVADTEDMKPVFEETARFAYVRLRRDAYSKKELEDSARKLDKFAQDCSDCFVYFKHDETGDAANKARDFMKSLARDQPQPQG